MPVNIEEEIKKLSPERRKKVEARPKQLIAEEMTLRELRKAHNLTQERLANVLKIGQEQVSRMEQRSDLLFSTLRGYVEAMGGKLVLVVEFPDRQPVIVSGTAELNGERAKPPQKTRNGSAARVRA